MDIQELIGRRAGLFDADMSRQERHLANEIGSSSFLVLGGAGSIGQAVTKEIFKRNPRKLHIVDISENNLVELVRDLRSSVGHIAGDFRTFALDIGSDIYQSFIRADGRYDYILNLSALKHVRSEKDPYTLMRMIDVNIIHTNQILRQAIEKGAKKYFSVSTDKAANPVNLMGASKQIMERFLIRYSKQVPVSTARFANVAFSDGSLLHGFHQRMQKKQPLAFPDAVKRYFVTPEESGELCLLAAVLGDNRDIYFPKVNEQLPLAHIISLEELNSILGGQEYKFSCVLHCFDFLDGDLNDIEHYRTSIIAGLGYDPEEAGGVYGGDIPTIGSYGGLTVTALTPPATVSRNGKVNGLPVMATFDNGGSGDHAVIVVGRVTESDGSISLVYIDPSNYDPNEPHKTKPATEMNLFTVEVPSS